MQNQEYARLHDLLVGDLSEQVATELLVLPHSESAEFSAYIAKDRSLTEALALSHTIRSLEQPEHLNQEAGMSNEEYTRLHVLWCKGQRLEVAKEMLTLPRSDVAEFTSMLCRSRNIFEASALVRLIRQLENTTA